MVKLRKFHSFTDVGQDGVGCESVCFDEFTSAVQLDLYRLSYHTTLSVHREDGLRNRWCAAA